MKFPSSYQKFIPKYNVGVPITNEFEFDNHSYVVERFLGLVNDYKTSSLGDYVCLDFRNNVDIPEVCDWYHEDSEEFNPVIILERFSI